jgi:hypothetical protein
MIHQTIPLTQLSGRLRDLTGREPPNYRKLWNLTADGKIPASLANGRHVVRVADLPAIAEKLEALGLMTAAPAPAPAPAAPSRKAAARPSPAPAAA